MDTDQPAAVTAPTAVAPQIEEKLVEVFELLDDVVAKFDVAFGAEPLGVLAPAT